MVAPRPYRIGTVCATPSHTIQDSLGAFFTAAPSRVGTRPTNEFQALHCEGSQHLLGQAVCSTSLARYDAHWRLWVDFCTQWNGFVPCVSLPFMAESTRVEQLRMLCAFIHFLKSRKGLHAQTIIQTLSGVRHGVRSAMGDVGIFADPAVAACRRAVSVTELRAGRRVTHQKLPFTMDMLLEHTRQTDFRSLQKHMVAAAMHLSFFGLFRVSEVVRSPERFAKGEDHALTAKDITFQLRNSRDIPFVHIADYRWEDILSMKVELRSAKNDQLRVGHTLFFTSDITTGINVVRTMFDWALASNPLAADRPVFAYESGGTYVTLTYDHIRNAVKGCARRMRLDVARFSTHSLRIGGASTLRAGGASDSLIQLLGRWRSASCALRYQTSSIAEFIAMQRILAAGENLDSGVVQLLAHIPDNEVLSSAELDIYAELND